MSQVYSNPTRASSPTSLPDIETFRVRRGDSDFADENGEPVGPFKSEAAAIRDAHTALLNDYGAAIEALKLCQVRVFMAEGSENDAYRAAAAVLKRAGV